MRRRGRMRSVVVLAAALGAVAVAGCAPPANELPVPELVSQTPPSRRSMPRGRGTTA